MRKYILLPLAIFLMSYLPASAQRKEKGTPVITNVAVASTPDHFNYQRSQSVETTGTVNVEGQTIGYTAKTGTLVLRNAVDTPMIAMSYTAYFKNGVDKSSRPITFLYNGGPGSSTIWLHIGCFGPQKVFINEAGRTQPPFKTVNNDYSLLDASDLVFIDAPGTGFGEVITKARGGAGQGKDYFGIDQDGRAFTDFIEKFLTVNDRWNSPKYLFGESYGTFRSAVVSRMLQGRGISLNSVILLSQLLTYSNMSELASSNVGSDLPYVLLLPSMTATAWYHHKLPNQPADMKSLLKEVEKFALTDYTLALAQGAQLDDATFHAIAKKLHDYTGLDQALIEKGNLRISGPVFEKNLLGDSSQVTGRLDSRFAGDDFDPLSGTPGYDPMNSYISPAFTAAFNGYMRDQLQFGKDLKYKTSGNVMPWDFKRAGYVGFPNVMNDLAQAMIYNPDMKVMLNSGYFDLGTPYFEGIYEMQHLPMPKALQKNIEYKHYVSGHMVYLHQESLKELHDNVKDFIIRTLKTGK